MKYGRDKLLKYASWFFAAALVALPLVQVVKNHSRPRRPADPLKALSTNGDFRRLAADYQALDPAKRALLESYARALATQSNPLPAAAVPPAVSASGVVSWEDAGSYVGQTVSVVGRIVLSHNSGRACFLNFHKDYRTHFTAVIFQSAFSKFPPNPEDYYLNKLVRVTGRIKEYRGSPEMILDGPGQIVILE